MGAFIISDISFKTKKDRERFEKKFKQFNILVHENSNSFGFGAWTSIRDVTIDVIYFMGFMGYAEPKDYLKQCLDEGIGITFWAWIPINDRNAHWEKIRGRW
jgi:hypothetical protein